MRRELLNECIQCGFCLPTCPTHVLWGEELDSPRGRIYLMELLLDGSIDLSPEVSRHFDRCLGCMACVTACPSGVQYDRLIELTRARVESEIKRPLAERAVRALAFAILPHPRRMRAALVLRPLAGLIPVPTKLRPFVEITPPWQSGDKPPEIVRPAGQPLARVGLLTGCVQSVLFGDVNIATARVLAAEGFEVVVPRAQGCCGALATHAGRMRDGLGRARRLIDVFDAARIDWIIANAAGCGSNLKDYGHLLAEDARYAERAARFSARVRDIHELLAQAGPRTERAPLSLRVAFQDACHLLHAQKVRDAPRTVLASIPELVLVEPAEQALCCGSAGIYNIVESRAAEELGRRKAANVLATFPDALASPNPGCLIQVTAALRRENRPLPAFHPIELVDASIQGVRPEDLLANARR